MNKVEEQLDKVDGRLDKADGRLDKADGRLDRLEKQIKRTERTLKFEIVESENLILEEVSRVHRILNEHEKNNNLHNIA